MDENNQIEELKKCKELLDQGIISRDEYDRKKDLILNAAYHEEIKEKEKRYNEALGYIQSSDISHLTNAVSLLSQIPGYKDADDLKSEIQKKIARVIAEKISKRKKIVLSIIGVILFAVIFILGKNIYDSHKKTKTEALVSEQLMGAVWSGGSFEEWRFTSASRFEALREGYDWDGKYEVYYSDGRTLVYIRVLDFMDEYSLRVTYEVEWDGKNVKDLKMVYRSQDIWPSTISRR